MTRYLIQVLPPEKTAPFQTLVAKVIQVHGGKAGAAMRLGVGEKVLRKLMEDMYLTDKSARLILAAYRGIKHSL